MNQFVMITFVSLSTVVSPAMNRDCRTATGGSLVKDCCSQDAAKEPAKKPAGKEPVVVRSLDESLAPLKERFNKARGKHRFVALLSPT